MSAVALIGPAIRIKGQVTAREPLTIAGSVDGTIDVQGHPVTIAAGGRIQANIIANEIVVGGEVKGQLDASERIRVNETASIEGNMKAPKVSVADGAKFQGKVETAKK